MEYSYSIENVFCISRTFQDKTQKWKKNVQLKLPPVNLLYQKEYTQNKECTDSWGTSILNRTKT